MFKKNKKQTENVKEKKVRTVKVGTHKKTVIALWVVLIASVSFGVYKNFTAIDQHTTHEKEIIELRLQDTNGIENFVKNFAKSYYTWNNSKEAIEARTQAINGYLTKELQDLNVDTIRTDIPTSSTVTDVIVWHIEQSGTDTFSATYEVDQQIKEGEQTSNVKATYTVKVHVDADGDMVIVQNPTLAPAVEKSDYEPKTPEADASVDADTVNDATAFLETFFKLYPHLLTCHFICNHTKLHTVCGCKLAASVFIAFFQNLLKSFIIQKASPYVYNVLQIHIHNAAGILQCRLIRCPVILFNRINRGFVYNIHQNAHTQKGDKKHG